MSTFKADYLHLDVNVQSIRTASNLPADTASHLLYLSFHAHVRARKHLRRTGELEASEARFETSHGILSLQRRGMV
jgi:hypothetical protein